MTRQGTRDRLAKFFRKHPGRWVSMLRVMALVPGRRTQAVSECRHELDMDIRNKKRWNNGQTESFYWYEPKDAA